MRISSGRSLVVRWMTLAMSAALLLTGCGALDGGTDVGMDDEKIVIGIHGPKSGPAAALTEGASAGFKLYIDEINKKGGISGRTLEVAEADDQYSVSGGAAAARQLADKAFLAYNIVGADPAIGALPEFERRGTPYLSIALPLELAQDSQIAFMFPTPLELLAEAVPSFIKGQVDPGGSKKVGLMWENQDIMRDMKDHFMAAADEAGLTVTATESFDRDAASYVQNVKRIRDSGADLVVLLGGVAVPGVLKAAKSIGYDPEWTGAGAWTYDFINAGSGGLMEGIKAVRSLPLADAPDYQDFLKRLHGTGRKPAPTDEFAYLGWVEGKFLEQVLQRLDGDLSRKRLIDELESGTSQKSPIAVESAPPLWYGADRRYGSAAAVPSEVKDGRWVAIGEPAERFGG